MTSWEPSSNQVCCCLSMCVLGCYVASSSPSAARGCTTSSIGASVASSTATPTSESTPITLWAQSSKEGQYQQGT
eukprot:CAMPEP_0168615534 /NCGR_PEP_ID=MMETSP0449_2-20121227/4553_1 /TAXON_ID=1082188 /ORGANISM="Strombidium rassoulzadegani, Strain ras09" /LENGTH=74 /DNA_ID=CAMNT_0008656275 /DNA_START=358 /DNA_END=580 /DNA_ORIENTATION=+